MGELVPQTGRLKLPEYRLFADFAEIIPINCLAGRGNDSAALMPNHV